MIYFLSDLHLGHNKVFAYEPRGFSSTEEMSEAILERWNEKVTSEDEVYLLGDQMLNDNEYGLSILKKLNGKIHIILGNHDTDTRRALYSSLPNVVEVVWATQLRYSGYTFYLSHYPTLTENFDEQDCLKALVINLYGHTHQKTSFFNDVPWMFHVGCDSNDCTPISIDDVIERCKEQWKVWKDKISFEYFDSPVAFFEANKDKVFRMWFNDELENECNYVKIVELIKFGDDYLIGHSPWDAKGKEFVEYAKLSQVTLALLKTDQEEEGYIPS